MADLCCAGTRKAGGVPTGPLGSADTKLSSDDDDGDISFGDRALSLFGGSKKPKAAMKVTTEEGFGARTMSLFGGRKNNAKDTKTGDLPPNWKKAKDKDNKVYYFNSVTQVRQYTVPRHLPKGWTEALHKESGRVYYVHKATRKTTFTFPAEGDTEEVGALVLVTAPTRLSFPTTQLCCALPLLRCAGGRGVVGGRRSVRQDALLRDRRDARQEEEGRRPWPYCHHDKG